MSIAQFEIERLGVPDLLLIRSKRYADDRGYFSECYNLEAFARLGISTIFVQDNHSFLIPAGGHDPRPAFLVRTVRSKQTGARRKRPNL